MSACNITAAVTSVDRIAEGTFSLRFHAPDLANALRPGQFLNILTSRFLDPLLRRPYSISNVHDGECEILFTVVGKGTSILSRLRPGDPIGVLGPLGNTFGYDKAFASAVILAGGIGVAPFPLLTRALKSRGKNIITFVGARNNALLVTNGLENVRVATDDGSEGYRGTVVDCLAEYLDNTPVDNPRIFACGPNVMLAAAKLLAAERAIPCELSLESEMACGVGICQGCPVERSSGDRKYALVCTEGPCFESGEIILHDGNA